MHRSQSRSRIGPRAELAAVAPMARVFFDESPLFFPHRSERSSEFSIGPRNGSASLARSHTLLPCATPAFLILRIVPCGRLQQQKRVELLCATDNPFHVGSHPSTWSEQ